jgi:uncharacterized protein (TIGR02611 family)
VLIVAAGREAFDNFSPVDEERRTMREQLQAQRDRHRERRLIVRVAFAIAGIAVLAAGLAMLVLPGPGVLAIAVGLGILALEFAWAERMLGKALDRLERVRPKERSRRMTVLLGAIAILGVLSLVAGIVLALVFDLP